MFPAPAISRRSAFTFVELLLALVLAALVAAILALLGRGLLNASEGQAARIHGPFAARSALRTLSREVACAYAPPIQDLVPLSLSTSTEPGKPEVHLDFFAPVPTVDFPGSYDVLQLAYEVHAVGKGLRELRRISAPCAGPYTNAPVTNILFQGRFHLAIEAIADDTFYPEWPLPDASPPALPPSLRFSLDLPEFDTPLQTEVLIQCAHGITSPVERKTETAEE